MRALRCCIVLRTLSHAVCLWLCLCLLQLSAAIAPCSLQAVGADDYNVALCMRGWEPVEGVEYEAPLCLPQVPSGGATLLPGAAALPEAPLLI